MPNRSEKNGKTAKPATFSRTFRPSFDHRFKVNPALNPQKSDHAFYSPLSLSFFLSILCNLVKNEKWEKMRAKWKFVPIYSQSGWFWTGFAAQMQHYALVI